MNQSRNESLGRCLRYPSDIKETTDWNDRMEDTLIDLPLAMAYVPWQFLDEVYEPNDALHIGTIFPELDKPFLCYRYGGGRV